MTCVDKELIHKHIEQTSRKGTVSEGEYIIDIETHLRFKLTHGCRQQKEWPSCVDKDLVHKHIALDG